MKYNLEIEKTLHKKLLKYSKSDKRIVKILNKKVNQILSNPYHFKLLRGNLHGLRRVHLAKSFVLTYEIYEETKFVRLIDFEHHDKVYD